MGDYHHGVRIVEINDGTCVISTVSTAVVDMVCTGDDADTALFPLNKPVLITDLLAAAGKVGKHGTLAVSLLAIADHARPVTIVVCVATGSYGAGTATNLIGGVDQNGRYTGMKALLDAQSVTGVRPRILGVPGLDSLPVSTALAGICQQLRAFGYISAYGCKTSKEALKYRENFSQRELMLIWPDFLSG